LQGSQPNDRAPGWRPSREVILAAVLWLLLTIAGEAIVLVWIRGIMPERYAETAAIIDDAFLYLTALAVPVFTFVIAAVAVSLLRFRSRGRPDRDGEPIRGTTTTYGLWLAITGTLAISLIVFPGLVGIAQLQGQADVEDPLVVGAEAARWAWTITYAESGVTTGEEMVLPVDRPVTFEVSSVDILHSFWIPAFRVKIDAVPGKTTTITMTPDTVGAFPDEPMMRIQCAELCGLNHSTMSLPIRVVEATEFELWLSQQGAGGAPTCEPDGTELSIVALDIAFDTDCLAAPADTPFTITMDNRDPDIPHNVSIWKDPAYQESLFVGEILTGPGAITYRVPPFPAGIYYFQCDIHPILAMRGALVVK
jgi:cytochrome c oxidase subunit 2